MPSTNPDAPHDGPNAAPDATTAPTPPEDAILTVALVGNPNTGKTTLFNALSGLRHKTGNFPGTTQEARVGRVSRAHTAGKDVEIIDLPGIYSMELAQSEAQIAREVLAGTLAAPGMRAQAPDAVCVVVDAQNLERNLLLVGEVLRRRLPLVVALNMIDLARKGAQRGRPMPDAQALADILGCDVLPVSAREHENLAALALALTRARLPHCTPPGSTQGLERWAEETAQRALRSTPTNTPSNSTPRSAAPDTTTDRIDRVLTHPILGMGIFAALMFGLFYTIFAAAAIPMGLIETFFGAAVEWTQALLPEGLLREFLAQGVVAGIGSTLIFLPQICLLIFLISLLEDTGYLARAAFLVDRFLRPFGLSGYAFVPLLSSHACAIPGIMSTRGIPDQRERLAAILVAPFMSCSARIPVYVLLTAILFPGRPAMQALAFIACYALGAFAGLFSALIARRTILRGKGRAMALELPTYKRPSLRTALLTTWDRALMFVKKAGTIILAICVVLWWLSTFPHSRPPQQAIDLRTQAEALVTQDPAQQPAADELLAQADGLEASHATSNSFLGRIGRTVQPVFAPLGYDWQLSVGVLASFAAREVFASTMAVITTGGDDIESEGAIQRIKEATRADGTPIFTLATSWSLLVYFVLAMQCLPTLAVTAREAGGAKWAFLQLAWMCGLAYALALVTYQVLA